MHVEQDPEDAPISHPRFSLFQSIHFFQSDISQDTAADQEERVNGEVSVADGVKRLVHGALKYVQLWMFLIVLNHFIFNLS